MRPPTAALLGEDLLEATAALLGEDLLEVVGGCQKICWKSRRPYSEKIYWKLRRLKKACCSWPSALLLLHSLRLPAGRQARSKNIFITLAGFTVYGLLFVVTILAGFTVYGLLFVVIILVGFIIYGLLFIIYFIVYCLLFKRDSVRLLLWPVGSTGRSSSPRPTTRSYYISFHLRIRPSAPSC